MHAQGRTGLGRGVSRKLKVTIQEVPQVVCVVEGHESHDSAPQSHTHTFRTPRRASKAKQIKVPVPLQWPNGSIQKLQALVDTGAEVNLVEKGLLSDRLMCDASQPLSFVTASGQPLEAGKTRNSPCSFNKL